MESKRSQKTEEVIDDVDGEEEEEEEDRISSLPDPILHEILSSMEDIKTAVQTCVLSKRWKYVWTSLPNLHFNFHRFPFPKMASSRSRFAHFVNQVLSLRDNTSDICKFHFAPSYCDDPIFIEKSLCYALCHNVQQLHVSPHCYLKRYQFPRCFINSESLTALKLVNCFKSMSVDESLRLPALKTLHLVGFSDESANFITETVGNCPNLETLILNFLSLNCFNITAPQLRKLELRYDNDHWIPDSNRSEFVVSAPRLTSFKLEGHFAPAFSALSLPCFVDVYIDLRRPFHASIEQRLSLNVSNMLAQLREANSVTLSQETLVVLAMDTDSLKSHPSLFHNLKHLK